jgi:hypothetical protein
MAPATASVISQALHPLNNDVGSLSSVAANDYWSQNYPQVEHYPAPAPTTTTATATLSDSTGILTPSNDARIYSNPNTVTHNHTEMVQNWAEQHTQYVANTHGHTSGQRAQGWQSGTINNDAVALWFNTPGEFECVDPFSCGLRQADKN